MSASPDTSAALAAARHLPGSSLPTGRVLLRVLRRDPAQEYVLYIPASAGPGAPVLACAHGISRNAVAHASAFAATCEKLGAVLVVPVFTAEMHADYQRLGREGRGVRADQVLDRCLEEAALLTGADVTRIRLAGFSGGAQFAHRYLMAHPHRVERAVIAAAGWYTFPDPGLRYPYGIRSTRLLPGVRFNPEEFLRVPIEVLVGRQDVGTGNVRRSERVDAQQGTTRLERARRWVAAMEAAAKAHGLEPRVRLTEVDDVDHSFTGFCTRGRLVERVGEALFPVRAVAVQPARVRAVRSKRVRAAGRKS